MYKLLVGLLLLLALRLPAQSLFDRDRVAGYWENEQYGALVQYLEPLHKHHPQESALAVQLGMAYYQAERMDSALAVFSSVLAYDSLNIPANRYMVNIFCGRNNYRAALPYCNHLMEIFPLRASLYKLRGDLFASLYLSDSALPCYQKAYQLDSQNAAYLLPYASALQQQKNYGLADSLLNQYLKKDTANRAVLGLAIYNANAQNRDSTVAQLARWYLPLEEESDISINIETIIIRAYYNLEMYDSCLALCRARQKDQLITEEILYYMAGSYSRKKLYTESNTVLDECLRRAISPFARIYWMHKAENYEALHLPVAAIAVQDSAYYLSRQPNLLFNIGRIYEADLDNPKQAARYYQRYLQAARVSGENTKESDLLNYVRAWLKKRKD